MSDLGYLAISKNRGKKGITSVFILIKETQNEESFFTRETLSWEDREILHLSSLFLLVLY